MQFTLFYRGILRANGNKKHKQEIRREFHKQLITIWEEKSFLYYKDQLINFYKDADKWRVGNFIFLPIVNNMYAQAAKLDIFILWPDHPGSIVSNRGDIDNRLKTLLDALRMPQHMDEIPKNDHPNVDEDIFYCLLEDDKLITKISIETDRLLYKDIDKSELILFIKVDVKPCRIDFDDAAYAF
jgi:hypothetical protein